MNETLQAAYQTKSSAIQIGGIVLNNQLLENAPVNLLLKSFNRHGLIAGATGSGKTKTIQVLCEQLSLAGIPSLVMDIKGDVSGLAKPGEANDFILARCHSLNLDFVPRSFPVELLSLHAQLAGVPLRATINDFGALLFSRMLDLNDTQAGVVTIMFEYTKKRQLKLVTLQDFKGLLQFAQTDKGKKEIEEEFGSVAGSTLSIILRKIIGLEAEGANDFFGEPAFDVQDLLRTNNQGQGIISILQLMDMQENPKLFSTFMLKLLTDLYKFMPEVGDLPKPKLVLFIDEAHLIFNNASKALLNLLETIVKLIRSKGVGLIFCTQSPKDIPDAVLSQLGLKIQHALRAFTAKDRQEIKLIAQNFPLSNDYSTAELLTSLDIGDAIVCALDERGQPTPLIQCRVRAPESRMGALSAQEISEVLSASSLMTRYKQPMITPSLTKLLLDHNEPVLQKTTKTERADPSVITVLSKNTLFRQVVRQVFREITSQLMKLLKGKQR